MTSYPRYPTSVQNKPFRHSQSIMGVDANIGRVYRTNLWRTTEVREFFRPFLEHLIGFTNENYIEFVSIYKH